MLCVLIPVSALLLPASALSFAPSGLSSSRAPAAARSFSPRMVLGLPRPPALPFAWGAAAPEVIYEGRNRIEYLVEIIHLTKRRISGSIAIDAPPHAVWTVCTAYEEQPDLIPSILSHQVSRQPDGRVYIDQMSLLSSKLNLRTEMRLQAIEDRDRLTLAVRRVSGHGFLEFDAMYRLTPRPGGGTMLRYSVELVPCPIFPLPLVERKVRKEVPKMLAAVSDIAMRSTSSALQEAAASVR